jgi:hypothetical protein
VFKPLDLNTQIEIAKLAVSEQLEIFRQKGFENLQSIQTPLNFWCGTDSQNAGSQANETG